MSRSITCRNDKGLAMTFDEYSFQPFLLAHVEGIYEARNEVVVSKNAMLDGGTFQGSTASIRNILLTVMCPADKYYRQQYRDELYRLFSKDTTGLFIYSEKNKHRGISYKVEYVQQGEIDRRLFNISLICSDPFFYALENTNISMADWIKQFEFVHEFVAEGEEFGTRSEKQLVEIDNELGVDEMGINIYISFNGEVVNPSIVKVEDTTRMKLGNEITPLTLIYGDKIVITTSMNDKHIYLIRNGVQTEINQYLSEDSDFITLSRGINTIGYEAEEGVENMSINITYKMKFEGA